MPPKRRLSKRLEPTWSELLAFLLDQLVVVIAAVFFLGLGFNRLTEVGFLR